MKLSRMKKLAGSYGNSRPRPTTPAAVNHRNRLQHPPPHSVDDTGGNLFRTLRLDSVEVCAVCIS